MAKAYHGRARCYTRSFASSRILLLLPIVGLIVGTPAPATAEFVFTTIDVPGAIFTRPTGINDAGQIVGRFDDATPPPFPGPGAPFGQHGFLLTGGVFTTIDAPGARFTAALDINDAGQIVGQLEDATLRPHGFLLTGGVFTTIDVPGAFATFPSGINNTGQIVGSFSDATGSHGFLLTGGVFTTIDVPGAFVTLPSGINDAGHIVGSFGEFPSLNQHGFLLTGGVFTTIDVPGAVFSIARGINNAGQIVGGFGDAPVGTHGFLLTGGVFTTIDIDVPFVVPDTFAFGINDAGHIVGSFPIFHGFLATPAAVPGAGTLVLVTSGLLALGAARVRSRPRQRDRTGGRSSSFMVVSPPTGSSGECHVLASAATASVRWAGTSSGLMPTEALSVSFPWPGRQETSRAARTLAEAPSVAGAS